MRIRIQLTFSVRREPRPESVPVPLEEYRHVDSLVERAEPFPLGFQAVPGREDQEQEGGGRIG